jgi:hypothetical protein
MNGINPIEYLRDKYSLDVTKRERINIPASRHDAFPEFLKDIGVTTMVEIGTYRGQYASTLMKLIPFLDLTAVDKFLTYGGYKDFHKTDLEIDARKEAYDRAEKYGFSIINEWSVDAAKQFEDESLDAIFIDGNHDLLFLADDLRAWVPKVKKGGIVSGHDLFDRRHVGYGVRELIPAYCEAYDIYPWFVWKKDKCPTWFYIKQ